MGLYPEIEPYDSGLLQVGDGNQVYWEVCGSPDGKPAVFMHGGPGSGCTTWPRRLFDPSVYRVVLFDQRNCGRSTPHASGPDTDLSGNTTWNLVADIERLRDLLGIDQWLVCGGSWGTVLSLAYATSHPARVSEMVLFGVATGRRLELDWLFRGGIAVLFPEEWERVRALCPERDIVEGYHQLLHSADPEVRRQAAYEWCLWESATPSWPPTRELSPRFQNPDYAFAFARLVTHYVRNNLWLEEDGLLSKTAVLAGLPGVIINGRFDFQSPLANAWELKRAWPRAEMAIVESAGHSASNDGIISEIVRATDRFGG